jgi:hypothetical protein
MVECSFRKRNFNNPPRATMQGSITAWEPEAVGLSTSSASSPPELLLFLHCEPQRHLSHRVTNPIAPVEPLCSTWRSLLPPASSYTRHTPQSSPPWPPRPSSGRSPSGTCDGHPTKSPLSSTPSSLAYSVRPSWWLCRRFAKGSATTPDHRSLSHTQVSTDPTIAEKEAVLA